MLFFVGQDKSKWEVLILLVSFPLDDKEVANLSFHQLVQVDIASVHQLLLSALSHLLLFLHNCGIVVDRIVAFLLIAVEDAEGAELELLQVVDPHAIADHVEHTADVRMLVVVLSDPPQPLVDPHDEIVQVVIALRVVHGQLFL